MNWVIREKKISLVTILFLNWKFFHLLIFVARKSWIGFQTCLKKMTVTFTRDGAILKLLYFPWIYITMYIKVINYNYMCWILIWLWCNGIIQSTFWYLPTVFTVLSYFFNNVNLQSTQWCADFSMIIFFFFYVNRVEFTFFLCSKPSSFFYITA